MSLRLTRKGFIASLDNDPSMAGLRAYWAGRRWYRDDTGHGGGTGGGDDNTGDDDADGDDDAEADDDEHEDDETAKDKKKDKKKKDDDEDEETVPKWKYDRLHTRMQAADRNATDLRKQLDDLKKSADVPAEVKRELDEIKAKVGTIEKERDDIATDRDKLRIRLAAVTMTGDGIPEWEDVETALQLADLTDVEVSDTGKVDKRALRSALRSLAKEKPYLVKKKPKKDSDGTDDNESGSSASTKMNGRRKGERSDAPSREQLASRFPALQRNA